MYKINHTKEDRERFIQLTRDGAVAVFAYSSSYLSGGEICAYGDDSSLRAIARGGEIYAPVSFFERVLGAEGRVSSDDGYLPVERTVRELGLCCGRFYDEKMVVIAEESVLEEIGADEALAEAGAYAIFGEYDASRFTSDDYASAKAEWRLRLFGSEKINDLDDPTIAEKIAKMDATCKELLSELNEDEQRVAVFGNVPAKESEDMTAQYSRLWQLGRVYGIYGSEFYRSERILSVVRTSLDWLRDHLYGKVEAEGRGWRDVKAFNWWDWYVGSALPMMQLLLMIEEYLTREELESYLECFRYATTVHRLGDSREFCSSRIQVCTLCALLLEDAEWLQRSHEDCDTLMSLVKEGEGIHEGDYINWTHGMPHNISYGALNLSRTLFVSSVLSNTPLNLAGPKSYNLFMLAKYCFAPALYHGQGFMMFAGRSTFSSELSMGCGIVAALLPMIGVYGEDEDYQIKCIIKRQLTTEDSINRTKAACSLYECAKLNAILADDSIPFGNDYEYAHAWYTGDRAAQHRSDYAFAIALSSERAPSYESINGKNQTGWYTGDGATYLYTGYDLYPFDGQNFINKNVNVAYRYPGTTADSRERVARSIRNHLAWRSPRNFVGSMQIEDKYLVAAMDFEAQHFEGPDSIPDDCGYGGSQPIHHNDLVAKKAWFCFDDEIVCLGAGIRSTMSSPVHTTLEHRRIVDKTGTEITVSAGGAVEKLPTDEYEKSYTGADFVNIKGHAGFVFPSGGEAYVHRYNHAEAGSQDFIEIRLEHGENPDGASYAYVVMPYATDERLAEYKASPDIEIIENSERLQAVREKNLGITSFVFHEPADRGGLCAQTPCLAVLGGNSLLVSDPTQKLDEIRLIVWSELEITEMDPEFDVYMADDRTFIKLDTRGSRGKKFEIKFNSVINKMKYRVSYSERDVEQFTALTESGMTALFLHSPNVMKNGKIFKLDGGARTISVGGQVYAPVAFFTEHLGISLSADELDGAVCENGVSYLPVIKTAGAKGLCAEGFYDGRLVVVGRAEHIAKMNENPMLEESGAYTVFGDYDISHITSADYTAAKDEWRRRIIGNESINNASDPVIAGKLSWLNTKCERALAQYNGVVGVEALFGDKKPVESDDLWQQYLQLADIAYAWGSFGTKYYHDERLLGIILEGLEWMYQNMYGEAEIAGTGWRDVRAFNWWHWFVGAPDALTDIMLIVEDYLTREQKERYLKCFRWVLTIMYADPKSGGLSRVKCGTKLALLLEDGERLSLSQLDCDSLMGLEEYGPRIHKADFVNWTHSFPHNISYGVENLKRGLYVTSILSNTALDFSGPKKYNQFNLIRYCFDPAMYGLQGFVMFSGRSTFANEMDIGASIIANALPMVGVFGRDEDDYLRSFIRRHSTTEEMVKKIKNVCSIYDIATFNSILNDPSISTENNYEYAHAWFTGDRAAQHRNGYAVGIAMSSRREKAYECINSANKTGWYTGDGALYLYTSYDRHQFDGANFLLKNENVAYRFPGTTEDSRPRVARSIANQWEWYPRNEYAGSLQLDGGYLVAAMDFRSLNSDAPDEHPDDYGYGGSQPIHLNDLVAKKAWFCFDDEIVCLGAGISSTMDSPVHTTVEHRRIVDAQNDSQVVSVGGNTVELPKCEYEKTYTCADFVNLAGHTGFVFPEGGEVYVHRYNHPEADGQDFMEIRLEHGKNPTEATYAYVILPYATDDRLAEYKASSDIEIISNTKAAQAVRERTTGVSFYAFYEPCTVGGITVDAPCIVAVSERDGVCTLSVSDPTHKMRRITATLDCEIEPVWKNYKISTRIKHGISEISTNVFMAHGRKFEIKYRK